MGNWIEQLELVAPELILLVGGCVLLIIGATTRGRDESRVSGSLACVVLTGALFSNIVVALSRAEGGALPFLPVDGVPAATAFFGNIVLDGLSVTFRTIALIGALLVTFLAIRYAQRFRNGPEFYALLLFATMAATLLCSAGDLVMLYLAFEFLSITSYILVCYLKFQPRSTEAGLKYLLYGAIAAAVMLYGFSLLYGVTGTTSLYGAAAIGQDLPARSGLAEIVPQLAAGNGYGPLFLVATLFVLVGLGFKTATAPFHQWAPDVYDGSPLPVMAWLTVTSTTAGFAVFLRVFATVLPAQYWVAGITLLSALTMTLGNVSALNQTSIKRMMAYSGIAHAGYSLMALAAIGQLQLFDRPLSENPWVQYGLAIYLATYVFMNVGVLAIITAVYERTRSHLIEDYRGLAVRSPWLAYLMLFFLLSLAGLPPTAGFLGKFILFGAGVSSGLIWLAVLAFVNSVVSVGYYWQVIKVMFLRSTDEVEPIRPGFSLGTAIGISAVATLTILVFANTFLQLFSGQ